MSTPNPITVQKQVRENGQDVQAFLNDLSTWSTHMKAKELAESGADLLPLDKVPPRNDPHKQTKEKENRMTKSEKEIEVKEEEGDAKQLINSSSDFGKWEKFDVEKACADVDKDDKKGETEEETEEQKVKRLAITLRLKTIAAEKKEKGNQFLKEKNYAKAIESYSEGIRCDKQNALLYSNRAQAYIFDKQFVQAVADCTESIHHDSTYVKSYFRRAKALIELNRFNEAKNDLNQALKLDPKNSEVRNMLNDLNRKTTGVKPGPKTPSPLTSPLFPGIRTLFSQNRGPPPQIYDEDYDDEVVSKKPQVVENYPKRIFPVSKPLDRRSKRPLLPVHVKVVGGDKEKRLRLDNGNSKSFDDSQTSSCSNSLSSSSVTSPVTTTTPPFLPQTITSGPLNSPESGSTLPTLFSKLQMASVPPKPNTAAQFTLHWKQIKANPDVSAQYLNQLEANDYLLFHDSMEYNILSDILDLLVWEFLPRKWDIIRHLVGLTKIRRFSTLLMFTTEKDRANIRKLISECPPEMQEILKPKYLDDLTA